LRLGAKRRLFLLLKEEWGIMEWEDDMQDACEGTSDGDYDDTREEEDEEEDAEEEEEEEEDEEEDIISDCDDHDLQPISMLPQINYYVLSEKDIQQRQEEATNTIINVLSISRAESSALLRHFKWFFPLCPQMCSSLWPSVEIKWVLGTPMWCRLVVNDLQFVHLTE
jgi:hypothetical protein